MQLVPALINAMVYEVIAKMPYYTIQQSLTIKHLIARAKMFINLYKKKSLKTIHIAKISYMEKVYVYMIPQENVFTSLCLMRFKEESIHAYPTE